ncbi:MAG: outer membrane protein assembly factor BamA, partial [Candidatus Zixiibacteriota bacterium]
DKEKYIEDKEKIIEYLHKQGYVDAYLKSDSVVIDTAMNQMDIYLDIYEGPQYYFGKTSFVGNEVFDNEVLSRVLKYKEGKIFDADKFDESFYEVHFIYQEKGYLHVRIQDDRKTEDSLINIVFDIVEGLPSEVNLVKIVGNNRTKEKVIRREMKMRPGQVFHRSLLMRSIRDVMALNFFNNVEPNIQDLPSGDVNLIVSVEEKPTAQVSAGAGYSGVDKFVGTFSLGIPNFRGMGQNLVANIDVGSQRNSYSLSFTDPWAFNTPTLMGGDIYYTNRDWYSDYTEGRRGGSVKIGRRLRWPDNYFRVYASYQLEQDRFYNFSDSYVGSNSFSTTNYISVYNDLGTKDSTYTINNYGKPLPGSLLNFGEKWLSSSSLQLSVTRDSRNLPEFATEGSIFSYNFETSGGILGGFWKYQKHIASFTQFIPVFWKVALAAKVTFGAVVAPENDSTILAYDRFSPGGTGYTGIVRGYDDGSLTPDTIVQIDDTTYYYNAIWDTTTESGYAVDSNFADRIITTNKYFSRIRGNYMMVTNIELQVPIIENQFYGLLFFDAGNSWLRLRDIRVNDVYKGVGLGFRLVVPMVGTIGFDFGYALDDRILDNDLQSRNQYKGWKTHFQIGTTFR